MRQRGALTSRTLPRSTSTSLNLALLTSSAHFFQGWAPRGSGHPPVAPGPGLPGQLEAASTADAAAGPHPSTARARGNGRGARVGQPGSSGRGQPEPCPGKRPMRMRPEDGARARLRSGHGRVFPPLCFKLRDDPFNFISPACSLFFFLACVCLVLALFCFNFFGRGAEEGLVFPSVSRYLTRVLCIFSVVAPGEGRAGEPRIGSKEENPPPAPREDRVPPPPTDTASPLPRQVSWGPRRGVGIRRGRGLGLGLPPRRYRGHGLCEARRGSWGRGGSATPVRTVCGGDLWGGGLPCAWVRGLLCSKLVGGCGGAGLLPPLGVRGLGKEGCAWTFCAATSTLYTWGVGGFMWGFPFPNTPPEAAGLVWVRGMAVLLSGQLPLPALGEGSSSGGKEKLDIAHSTPSYPVVWRSLGHLSRGQGWGGVDGALPSCPWMLPPLQVWVCRTPKPHGCRRRGRFEGWVVVEIVFPASYRGDMAPVSMTSAAQVCVFSAVYLSAIWDFKSCENRKRSDTCR